MPSPRLLTAARVLAGLSQGDLAKLSGVHRSAIARYEGGATRIRTDKLKDILAALKGCGVHVLGPSAEWAGGVVVISNLVGEDTKKEAEAP